MDTNALNLINNYIMKELEQATFWVGIVSADCVVLLDARLPAFIVTTESASRIFTRPSIHAMMASSHENIFRVTVHMCGNSPVTGEVPALRPVTRSFDVVVFYLRLDKRLSKQS